MSPSASAVQIQSAWRSYTNTKIFKYYKDLITFKFKGNPRDLLKTINPSEAAVLDRSANVHVRFRLGGEKFPPLIYYKIYIHTGICDINSFAPRDYAAMKRFTKKSTVNIRFEEEEAKELTQGWYERRDNNGWRPITDNILTPFDKVELFTSQRPIPFHHDKLIRRGLVAQKRREKKLSWLRKLYSEGKCAEEQDHENPFDSENLGELNDSEFDDYAKGLMEWSEALDFDSYLAEWAQVATSMPVEESNHL